jgi:GNAT superfamily N-acetyltransferase
MLESISIRLATAADAPTIAGHRAKMFRDMGDLPADQFQNMVAAARRDLTAWLTAGTYVGWLAAPTADPAAVVAGAGIQLRPLLPRPGKAIRAGPEAIVVNVYTEPEWRRRGVARCLMERVIAWSRTHEVARLVLHASADGRALYEQLGFAATNEMYYSGDLSL